MTPLLWAILALVLGLALVGIEIFVPSGGILGFLSFSCIAIALVLAFMDSTLTGTIFLLITMIAIPTILFTGLKYLPSTPMGRRVLLAAPNSAEVLPNADTWGGLAELVGQTGRAKTMMLPSGAIEIKGRTIDAMSEGVPIDPGQLIRVIEVRANRVVVRPLEEGEEISTGLQHTKSGEVDLSQPIDSLGLNPFENPLS